MHTRSLLRGLQWTLQWPFYKQWTMWPFKWHVLLWMPGCYFGDRCLNCKKLIHFSINDVLNILLSRLKIIIVNFSIHNRILWKKTVLFPVLKDVPGHVNIDGSCDNRKDGEESHRSNGSYTWFSKDFFLYAFYLNLYAGLYQITMRSMLYTRFLLWAMWYKLNLTIFFSIQIGWNWYNDRISNHLKCI